MGEVKLFMLLLGCKPAGRNTEQHDVYFGIGGSLKELIPGILAFWPAGKEKIHIDAWREVTCVSGYSITVLERKTSKKEDDINKKSNALFFINLGGYKENEFEEFHYKMLVVDNHTDGAKAKARNTAFHKHTTLPNSPTHQSATSHIDDKYGVDVDDVYAIDDILPLDIKNKYEILISLNESCKEDSYHLGYLKLSELG